MRKIFSIFILALFGLGLMAQGGKSTDPEEVKPKKLVDIKADIVFPYKITEDSSVLCLVGNFAAHHNGAIITADSAVRYGDDRLECFGNVLINKNTTYAYAERADYNGAENIVTLYSRIIKVVDEEAILYTYNFTFNTLENIGHYWGGGVMFDKDNRMESRRGYYYSDLAEIVGVEEVEISTTDYDFKSDSARYNLETEFVQYFANTNIWNRKGEYFFANEGIYDKSRDLVKITKDSYMLRPEQEMWSDSLEYYRLREHVTLRQNVQIDDTTNKTLAFGDKAEYWGDMERALLTKRPLVISYDTTESDSLFLRADTIELITHNSEVDKRRAVADSIARAKFVVDSTRRAVLADSLRKVRIVDSLRVVATSDSLRRVVVADSLKRVAVADSLRRASGELLQSDSVTSSSPQSQSVEGAAPALPEVGGTEPAKGKGKGGDRPARGKASAAKPAASSTKATGEQSTSTETTSVAQSQEQQEQAPSKDELRELRKRGEAELKAQRESEKEAQREALLEAKRLRDSVKYAQTDSLKGLKLIAKELADSLKGIKAQEKFVKDSLAAAERMIANEEVSLARQQKRNAYLDALKAREARKVQKRQERIAARNLRRGIVVEHDHEHDHDHSDSLSQDSLQRVDSLRRIEADSLKRAKALDSLMSSRDSLDSIYVDSIYRLVKAYRNVRSFRTDFQSVSDSLVNDSRDSTLHLYIKPIIWNESNQITAEIVDLFTKNGTVERGEFQGDPIMASEIDTTFYNQVKGKKMFAYLRDGQIYRNDVENNVETIYFMQDDDTQEVTTMVVVQSGSASFYIENNELKGITYRTEPIYTFYPLDKIPSSVSKRLKGFEWHGEQRPTREELFNRVIRPSQRESKISLERPLFPIDMSIQHEIIILTNDRRWVDRTDVVAPHTEEWLNSLGVKSGQPRPKRE